LLRNRCRRGLKPARSLAENTVQDPFEPSRHLRMTFPSPASEPMLRRIAAVAGWLALFAALALLSPGVVLTAYAAEPESTAGPSCPLRSDGDEHTAEQLSQMIERLRGEVSERDDASSGAVSLNTRGFNYANTSASLQNGPQTR
jgi:hypothetical protein